MVEEHGGGRPKVLNVEAPVGVDGRLEVWESKGSSTSDGFPKVFLQSRGGIFWLEQGFPAAWVSAAPAAFKLEIGMTVTAIANTAPQQDLC